jgi:Acetyltransferase (GNAT) domain
LETDEGFKILDAGVSQDRDLWLRMWRSWPSRQTSGHPAYVQLFARPGDRSLCATMCGPRGSILFPVILRPLATERWSGGRGNHCDLTTPYGYGGPFGWGTPEVDAFWENFCRWAIAINAVSLFARLSPFKEHLVPFAGDLQIRGACIIVSLHRERDAIWKSYEKSIRENVRQAQRAGVTIEIDHTGERLGDFLTIYYSTLDRRGALPIYYFPESFFRGVIANLSDQCVFFHALYQGKVVSTELILHSNDHAYAFLGGSLPEAYHLRPNHLLRHTVNIWGRDHGKTHLAMGGGNVAHDSLFQYKKRFAPDGTRLFTVGTRVFDTACYQELIERRQRWEALQGIEWRPHPGFFPVYRA